MNKLIAEFIGTAVLVLIGCGAAVLGGDSIGQTGIALAFGFAIVAMAYAIGPISGCHINPAVSLALYVDGRLTLVSMIQHWVAQFAGALAGALILLAIVGSNANLGQNGWGPGYLGEYSMVAALLFEIVFTAIFVVVILGSTGERAAPHLAGLAIGLTLAAIHLVGIQVTGVSVNPAQLRPGRAGGRHGAGAAVALHPGAAGRGRPGWPAVSAQDPQDLTLSSRAGQS